MQSTDILSILIEESKNYLRFDDFENFVQANSDLSNLPLQPLYLALKSATEEQIADILPQLSAEQRQGIVDLELWKKDEVDPLNFERWPNIYARCQDLDVVQEFARSDAFILFVKSSFTISTFDLEDPTYPEHDNFFLTDDNLLLFEYQDGFEYAKEVQYIIKNLYATLGVEHAYTYLFKNLVDSFYTFQEEAYQEKKERLRDYGFVDYYEALSLRSSFPSFDALNRFIERHLSVTGRIEALSKNQVLHAHVAQPFSLGIEPLSAELDQIKDMQKRDFLQFNFIRLINAQLTLDDAYQEGSLGMGRVGTYVKHVLLLGLSYAQNRLGGIKNPFEVFNFWDLFKIGYSAQELTKKKLKKILAKYQLDDVQADTFLGQRLNLMVDKCLSRSPMVEISGCFVEVNNYERFLRMSEVVEFMESFCPYIVRFYSSFVKLNQNGVLDDSFYLNYSVDDINFESILLSSVINFERGNFEDTANKKMGLHVSEVLGFWRTYFLRDQKGLSRLTKSDILRNVLERFQATFGLENVGGNFTDYVLGLMKDHLEGYDFESLSFDDYKHVGGPIILNSEFENKCQK